MHFWLLLTATIIYLIGVVGVTALDNIPLNNTLDSASLPMASAEEIIALHATFEKPWNTWNTVRTAASLLALGLVIGSCLHTQSD